MLQIKNDITFVVAEGGCHFWLMKISDWQVHDTGSFDLLAGAVKTELLNSVAPSATKDQVGIEPVDIANAVTFAVSQPKNVDVSDIAVQPSRPGLNKLSDKTKATPSPWELPFCLVKIDL